MKLTKGRREFEVWRAWRREHYGDGTPRADGEPSFLLDALLSTRSGAIAILRSDRREAKKSRPQHTPPALKDADYLHAAYGRRKAARR